MYTSSRRINGMPIQGTFLVTISHWVNCVALRALRLPLFASQIENDGGPVSAARDCGGYVGCGAAGLCCSRWVCRAGAGEEAGRGPETAAMGEAGIGSDCVRFLAGCAYSR